MTLWSKPEAFGIAGRWACFAQLVIQPWTGEDR